MLTKSEAAALPSHWQTARFRLALDQVLVMAIINVTPDSFSGDSESVDTATALQRCEAALQQGAHILDIGGESTRPGAAPVPVDEEKRRLLPVLRAAVTLKAPVSVDTSQPALMQAALDLGADIINDVRALRQPQALQVCAAHPLAGLCLMHMPGEPDTMQALAQYQNVTQTVRAFLAEQAARACAAGIAPERIVLDPGFGFGKQLPHNLQLMHELQQLLGLGHPLMVGLSRKGMLGVLTGGKPPPQRAVASAVAALAACQRGAQIVRVHDVAATVDALAVWRALM